MSLNVGDTFLHLVVKNLVEDHGILAGSFGGLLAGVEVFPVADFFGEQWCVDNAHLYECIGSELVIEFGHRREDAFLLVFAHAVIAGVIKGNC